MSSVPAAAERTLCLFEPPYHDLIPCDTRILEQLDDVEKWKGRALVWHLAGHPRQAAEFDALLQLKAPGLPLLVLLPAPHLVDRVEDRIPAVRTLHPRMILPHGLIDTPYRLRQCLALPPRNLPAVLCSYLVRRRVLRDRRSIGEVHRIVELAAETPSIGQLSRRMYTSRRTLGRHFVSTGLPVPSHILAFARLLHACVQLQADTSAMFRIARRLGYPDGFTMSNQMKRILGARPSEVRELLGWEWVVEQWLKREGLVR